MVLNLYLRKSGAMRVGKLPKTGSYVSFGRAGVSLFVRIVDENLE